MSDEIVWIDLRFQPHRVGFCPSEEAWKKFVEGYDLSDCSYPTQAGCATEFTKPTTNGVTLITLADFIDKLSPISAQGIVVHECTHAMQNVLADMEEAHPGVEFQAYLTQYLFEEVMAAYLETRKPTFKKSRPATSKKKKSRRDK